MYIFDIKNLEEVKISFSSKRLNNIVVETQQIIYSRQYSNPRPGRNVQQEIYKEEPE
ncbi:hypothetical protein SAE01_33230 [Segetibacter aerophilus]|uniref:Uncharacterized protein n=1 Tax=Segetibacter aerophilus TaxID=670293 RepID=A0A512BG61_9BACT|nr:hypothetical protein SAE01_33230 [Segetibacter aerophilus]